MTIGPMLPPLSRTSLPLPKMPSVGSRLAAIVELSKRRNVHPINVALAYVLNQPFPTFPLIGPRTLAELRTSLPALDVALTPDDVKWLNLEG